MKCFKMGIFPNNNNFLTQIKKFKKKKKYKSSDIVFVTKDTIEKFADIDINLVLLTNVPSLEEMKVFFNKYPNRIRGYVNLLAHEIHFPQIVETIKGEMLWVSPNVNKIIMEILAKKASVISK